MTMPELNLCGRCGEEVEWKDEAVRNHRCPDDPERNNQDTEPVMVDLPDPALTNQLLGAILEQLVGMSEQGRLLMRRVGALMDHRGVDDDYS